MMIRKLLLISFIVLYSFLFSASVSARGNDEFGPVRYEVRERYGRENVYLHEFRIRPGKSLVMIRNGFPRSSRVEFIAFTLNGQELLRGEKYDYAYIVSVAELRTENSFLLLLKDMPASGFKRPPLPPRFVLLSITPFSGVLPKGVFGLHEAEDLEALSDLFERMNPESAALAASAVDLGRDLSFRSEKMRKLGERKDPGALPFITSVLQDGSAGSAVRGQAAAGLGLLGSKDSIVPLMNAVLDPDDSVRTAAARSLARYPEDHTAGSLEKMLARLDAMRRDGVVRAIAKAGWKPVNTLIMLAEQNDPHAAKTAIEILGTTGDARAVDLLITLLQQRGDNLSSIISALGELRDNRALEPLLQIAQDTDLRRGRELVLANALVSLGDKRAAAPLQEMIRNAETRQAVSQLQQAYKQLTGEEYLDPGVMKSAQ